MLTTGSGPAPEVTTLRAQLGEEGMYQGRVPAVLFQPVGSTGPRGHTEPPVLGQLKPRSAQKVIKESYSTTFWRTSIRTDSLLSEPPTHHKPSKVSGRLRGIPWCLWVPKCRARHGTLTDAGGHRRAALLIALGTAVAGEASHAVLAWALSRGLVAGLASCTDWVAVTSWVGEREMVM